MGLTTATAAPDVEGCGFEGWARWGGDGREEEGDNGGDVTERGDKGVEEEVAGKTADSFLDDRDSSMVAVDVDQERQTGK